WVNGAAFIQPPESDATRQSGLLYVRSHELALSDKENSQASLPFEVVSINPVGAEVRVELAPVGWQSQELWEAKLSHRSLSEKRLSRGDQVFATPQVGYFFASEGQSSPSVLRWPFLAPGSLMFEI
ncbi:sulfate ABC transporter ATP-binding protein, partial [Vibrio cholerae]